MNTRKKMTANIIKSLVYAIAEYEHKMGINPTKIFTELDSYYALQETLSMSALNREIKFCGIPVEPISKEGIGIYLCGEPVTIRDFSIRGNMVILPEQEQIKPLRSKMTDGLRVGVQVVDEWNEGANG